MRNLRHLPIALLALLLASVPAAASALTIYNVQSGDLQQFGGATESLTGNSLTLDGALLSLDLVGGSTQISGDVAVSLSGDTLSVDAGQTVQLGSDTASITGTCQLNGSSIGCGFTLANGSFWRVNQLEATAAASPMPEPAAVLLFGTGALIVGFAIRKR